MVAVFTLFMAAMSISMAAVSICGGGASILGGSSCRGGSKHLYMTSVRPLWRTAAMLRWQRPHLWRSETDYGGSVLISMA
jgi:hypothetical protein